MTKNNTKNKKVLAREILIFFSGLGLIGIVWCFLVLRNSYYNNRVESSSANIKSLQITHDSLPKDYIKEFYDQTNRYFIVNYLLGTNKYAIAKEQEQEFLYDNYGIKKNVVLLHIYPKGYSYFNIDKNTIDIFKRYGGHLVNPQRLSSSVDSTVVFDFVPLDKFRELMKSNDYKEKLFLVFSNSPDQDGNVNVNSLIDKPTFDPMIPYNGIFDLGTLSEFKSKMNEGLQYNHSVIDRKNKIEKDILSEQKLISISKNSLLASHSIHDLLLYTLFVIGLLLYPFRLSVLLIVWASKTIKQKQ